MTQTSYARRAVASRPMSARSWTGRLASRSGGATLRGVTALLVATLLFGLLPRPVHGSFSSHADVTTGDTPFWVALGDLNGDGRPDIVTANAGNVANTVSVLLSTTV